MRKKVWSVLLAVMMVFTMFPVGVWAKDEAGETEDSAFQVGENLYSTLDEAMIAGDTITLSLIHI